MRIAIDARPAEKEGFGIARYTYGLISALQSIDNLNEYFLLVNSDKLFPLVTANEKFSLYKIKSKWMGIGEQIELPLVLRKIKPDIFHATSFVAPIFNVSNTVITIHDLIHLIFPEHYGYKQKIYYNFFLKRILEKSKQIISVSESTKRDLMKFYKLKDDKIKVVYNGLDKTFSRVEDANLLTVFKKQLRLPEKYALYIGNRKKHKNIVGLFRAFSKYKMRNRDDLFLLISGEKDNNIVNLATKFRIGDWLIMIGNISDQSLPLLYSAASLFIYLSYYEGFGFPPLEAMACGVPVIVSNTSSLPEVVGDAGMLVDPDNVTEVSNAINRVLTDHELARKMKLKGLERAKSFTWERTARETLKIYQAAATI